MPVPRGKKPQLDPMVCPNPLHEGSKVTGNVSISINVADNSGSAGLSGQLLINGKQVLSVTGGSFSYSWNTRKLLSGSYTIQVVAVDAAGNRSTNSVQVAK